MAINCILLAADANVMHQAEGQAALGRETYVFLTSGVCACSSAAGPNGAADEGTFTASGDGTNQRTCACAPADQPEIALFMRSGLREHT